MFKLSFPIKTLLYFLLTASKLAIGGVWVQPGGSDSFKSEKYFVRIIQDENVYESFVYKSNNKSVHKDGQLTDNNHWTNFSFEGEITIEVTKLFGDPIRYCIVRPKETRLKPEVDGFVFRLVLESPRKLYVEINEAEEDPLFIFANAPEKEIPDIDGPVLYYGPGIHDIGLNYAVKNKDIYIAGGAYVIGSFEIENTQPVKVYGRGIISGSGLNGKPVISDLIYAGPNNNATVSVEGITFTDAHGFCINSNKITRVNNVKCFGWSAYSKGMYTGSNSQISDCFLKVGGDNFTINNPEIGIGKCVIWQQKNGAPFQFTCYKQCNINNISITDNDIIRMDIYNDSIWDSDRTIFNCTNLDGGILSNVMVNGLRVEGNVHRLLGFNLDSGGAISNITFKNVNIEGVLAAENFISAQNGSVSNILFDNVVANYMKITNEYDAYIEKRGNVGDIKFLWRNY